MDESALIVYAALVVLVHLAGTRELAQINSFGLVVLLLISNVVRNAMVGDDNSVTGGLIGGLALIVVNYFVVRFLFRRAKLDRLIAEERQSEAMARLDKLLREVREVRELRRAVGAAG